MRARPSAITVALVLALGITATWWQLAERRARAAEARFAEARARVATLSDSLRARGRSGEGGAPSAVLADLARHPELIPYPGVRGGSMRFYPSLSRELAPGWVFGYFEDGHVAGHGLFEYHTLSDGTLGWKRLAATLE